MDYLEPIFAVSSVGSELKRILRNLSVATADSKATSEADLPAQIAQICRVDNLWLGYLHVLLEHALVVI